MLSNLIVLFEKGKAVLKRLKELAEKDIAVLWNNYRKELIILGALILTIKFRDMVTSFLVSGAQRVFDNATKKDASEKLKEDKYNNQANDLVKQTDDLAKKEVPVKDVDWYKK